MFVMPPHRSVLSDSQKSPGSFRLLHLDVLRAVAALLVCLHHFDRGEKPLLGFISSGGHLGVNIFFVLSGFVIPLALYRSGFRYLDTGTFFLARLARLYPAYFVTGALAIALHHASSFVPGFAGQPPSYSSASLWANATLTCDLTGHHWIVPIFWTLAIEAQFYILLAVSFPLLVCRKPWSTIAVVGVWICVPLAAGNGPTVFSWTALFAIGISIFLYREAIISSRLAFFLFLFACLVETAVHGWSGAAVGAATAAFIVCCPNLKPGILVFIGLISYSLYLLHPLIGGRVVNLTWRWSEGGLLECLFLGLAIGASVFAAWVMYIFLERPSHELSRSISVSCNKRNRQLPMRVGPRV